MCGIAGFLNITSASPLDEAALRGMTTCLAHRGPDADGFYFDGKVGLGHRRLSILDLSTAANQPMHSHNERYVIIFNGEVYNFHEIAEKLGVPMRTTSDTEVILEAYVRFGPEFVHLMNGMFAIAIYDKQTQTLDIFRDRMGIKPVYYYLDNQIFAFASELKSIVHVPEVKKTLTIDAEAVRHFLHLGYIPRPHSIYSQIRKMDSGSYVRVSGSELTETRYWKLEDQIKDQVISDRQEAKAQLNELLVSSVRYRMIADVPFGTFLSGGVDSSLVTAIAQSVSSTPVKTFSIGFDSAKHNESDYAKAVADKLGTNHHSFQVTYKEAMDTVGTLAGIYDEPFADSSAVPTLMVSKLARQHVTMTLSGDGGDELFHGYGMYTWANRLARQPLRGLRQPAAAVLGQMGNRYKRVAQLVAFPDAKRERSHIFSQEQYLFTETELDKLLQPKWQSKAALREQWQWPAGRTPTAAEKQALFDMQYYLQDDLLVKVDRATMEHSLETRVPLLDYRVVQFALNVAPQLKMHDGESKSLLKDVLYDYLPRSIFQRPKWGFSVPLGTWLKNELHYLIDEHLSAESIESAGFVQYSAVKQLVDRFERGEDYLYNRIWLLIVLHQWLALHRASA
ncbi:asparagine synthase (glutamine-hydrolyzing) [Hymenobacter sp. BT491]|uniref:asparagine synthase (glutamine-hydrolyzing) n=1 Tax=Hymenobacter sp. BT491 TaxID=2766779 RepID=UPI001653B75F|nr:asparagine synthase (glutamine-hydrolyzing) [Hymenobacter sp. BT491]MBC6988302.1 asparagine synthase (glutamine-hydrolyzing) [Hymenobacter sp. BT491]